MHVHVDSADKDKLDYLAETARKNETMLAMIGGLGYGEKDFIPNEQVIEICKKYPDCFIPIAKLTLWDKADPAEVYHYAEMGARGFKCIYPYYEYDHDLYMPLYEAAEKCGMPILFHTGNYRPCHFDTICRRPMIKNMQPLTLDRIARSFQQLLGLLIGAIQEIAVMAIGGDNGTEAQPMHLRNNERCGIRCAAVATGDCTGIHFKILDFTRKCF
jgi:predicted TIM-barrel fold metal-dependent hydrolase